MTDEPADVEQREPWPFDWTPPVAAMKPSPVQAGCGLRPHIRLSAMAARDVVWATEAR